MPGGVDRGHARQPEVPGEVRVDERRDERPGRAVDVDRNVDARLCLERVERVADLLHRLVGAVEGRAEDRDDPDRVLVAELHGLLGREVEAVALHRHEAHLDVPVVGELLPAHLDVDAHHQVRLVGRLALGRAPLLPASLEREAAEHRRLARAGGRAAGRLPGFRRVPQAAEHVDAARLELGGLRVLVLVDHVLVEALGHQLLGLRLHPGSDEGRHVQPRVSVEHQLVVDDLVGHVGRHLSLRELVPRNRSPLETEERLHREILGEPWRTHRVGKSHRVPFRLLPASVHGRLAARVIPFGSFADQETARERTPAPKQALLAERPCSMPGKGLEPLRPQRGHLILSQARMTSFATPARRRIVARQARVPRCSAGTCTRWGSSWAACRSRSRSPGATSARVPRGRRCSPGR